MMKSSARKSYSELSKLLTFDDRFEYLKLVGSVGSETFGFDRYLNQALYRSKKWRRLRNDIIIRDNGCDLGIEDRCIFDMILVHHINPITIEDLENGNPEVFDPDNLICVSKSTHNAIHYSNSGFLGTTEFVVRRPNDMCPWRKE